MRSYLPNPLCAVTDITEMSSTVTLTKIKQKQKQKQKERRKRNE